MIGWILHQAGRDPTVMNGAVMKNFVTADTPFASALVGSGDVFVSEVDESDGSIALYEPDVAVLNNITLDHKSLDELRHLFRDFAAKAETVVLNLDDDETRLLAAALPPERLRHLLVPAIRARISSAPAIEDRGGSIRFARHRQAHRADRDGAAGRPGRAQCVERAGRHRRGDGGRRPARAEAIAALAGVRGPAPPLRDRRRTRADVTVIDDFGHNPDKIAATLRHACTPSRGRLLALLPAAWLRPAQDDEATS